MARTDLPCIRRQSFPVLAAIAGAENIARLLVLHAPGGDENVLRILRIKHDVVEHVIVAGTELGKPRPVMPVIAEAKMTPRAGSQKDVIGILRIISEAADVAAIRPQNRPLAGPRSESAQGTNSNKISDLTEADFIVIFSPTFEKV